MSFYSLETPFGSESASHKANQCGLAAMPRAFGEIGLERTQFQYLGRRERCADHLLRIKVRQLRGATGLVVELLRRITQEHQYPADLQRADDIGKQALAHRRVGELHEYCDHAVVPFDWPRPAIASGYAEIDGD